MTRDDIIRMAREADGHMNSHAKGIDMDWDGLERFAKLVAAAEREECAKEVEHILYGQEGCGKATAAIRARGQQ